MRGEVHWKTEKLNQTRLVIETLVRNKLNGKKCKNKYVVYVTTALHPTTFVELAGSL